MSLLIASDDRPVEFVLHPSDRSEASQTAFHHALAIGVRLGAHLTFLHAIGRRSTDSWPGFPSVRDTLARWRTAGQTESLEEGIRRSSVNKVEVKVGDPVAASLEYIRRHSVDMIVVATEGRGGLARLIRAPRAETLAREAKLFTLFVPHGSAGFVSAETGAVTLERILVPVAPSTDPRPAMLRAVRAAALLERPSVEITLLHVGEGDDALISDVPELPFCRWRVMQRSGDVVEQILGTAEEISADAIYMSTSWQRAVLGRLEGGVTESVLRSASCPVAAVPAEHRRVPH